MPEIFSKRYANQNRDRGLFSSMAAVLTSTVGLISDNPLSVYGLFSGLMFFCVSLVYFSKYITWSLGAKGEERVIGELSGEGDYRLLNDIRLPNMWGNIDHVLIGENGIFVIETKNNEGYIRYDGNAWTQEKTSFNGRSYLREFKDPIKQARNNAIRLKEFISEHRIFSGDFVPWVNTIVVFTNPKTEIQIEKTSVDVVKVEELWGKIRNKSTKIKLRKDEIDKLFEILKNQTNFESDKTFTEDLDKSGWFKSYLKYMKFGLIWGIFYAIPVTLISQSYNLTELIDEWLFSVVFNGIILFVLGKLIIDFIGVRINSDFLRLLSVHFISYLPLFLFTGFFFTTIPVIEYPVEYIAELMVRGVVVVLTVKVYKVFKWRIPT